MIRYIVTTSTASSGANLARIGSWGNRPFDTDAAARAFARADAGGEVHTITQETIRRPLRG